MVVRVIAAGIRLRRGPAPSPAEPDEPSDRGAIVLGWFTKIAISMALLGMLLFDAVSIAEGRAHVTDAATAAADAAQTSYLQTHRLVDANVAAARAAAADGATLAPGGITLVQKGTVVTLTVTVDLVASTTLVGRLPGTTGLTTSAATTTRQLPL